VTDPHFFVEGRPRPDVGDRVQLSAADSSHALRSRRLRRGEAVSVSDGRSWVGHGTLADDQGGLAVIQLDQVSAMEAREAPEVTVTLAPPKGDRLTWAVQKLSELGVDRLNVLESERSVRRPGRGVLSRLEAVAREAAMQSVQPVIMRVGVLGGFDEAILPTGGATVLLHEAASGRLHEVLPDEVDAIHLLVGPEGGFSEPEVDRARAAGLLVASLGPSILRSETAAVVGAALVLARYGRLG
jgi:16S rRNA (uracil1498-N3)-methyltransferase